MTHDTNPLDPHAFDYAQAGDLAHGLIYHYEDYQFNAYFALGKPDWMPVGLVLLHNDHAFLKDILASKLGRHNLPPEDCFAALKRDGYRLLYNATAPAGDAPIRATSDGKTVKIERVQRTPEENRQALQKGLQDLFEQMAKQPATPRAPQIGRLLQDAGYFWLMSDAASRAIPLRNGQALEAGPGFVENVRREAFQAVRRACADYLQTVLAGASELIARAGTAVEGQLIHLPGYTPWCAVVDVTP